MTVCHRLGNGSYNLLTFDDSALKGHLGHDDIHPVPDGGCPSTSGAPTASEPGVGEEGSAGMQPGSGLPADEVLGVEAETVTPAGSTSTVLGTDATEQAGTADRGASVSTSAPRVARTSASAPDVLPATGAGPVALTLAAGLALLGAGAGLLARRRLDGRH